MNPLDTDQPFAFEVSNPNPSSAKTKSGPVYRVSFELHQEDWQQFMDAETKGMVLELQGRVVQRNTQVTEVTEKPKGGAKSREAAFLCQEPGFDAWAGDIWHAKYDDPWGSSDRALGVQLIYRACNIQSRAELDHDADAYAIFKKIERAFHRRQQ